MRFFLQYALKNLPRDLMAILKLETKRFTDSSNIYKQKTDKAMNDKWVSRTHLSGNNALSVKEEL